MSLFSICKESCKADGDITFGTSADAPPFELIENGEIKGFDIALAKLVASKLGKIAKFVDMPFGSLVQSLDNGSIDFIIASMSVSEEKKEVVNFSKPYYAAKMAIVYKKGGGADSLRTTGGKIALQLGTNCHEKIIKNEFPAAETVFVDTLNQAVEGVKSGQFDAAFMDEIPAKEFCKKNDALESYVVAEYKMEEGYAIVAKKGFDFKAVNRALEELEASGEIERLKKEYIDKDE
jgi:polar amino acid transport system substrate-binding protein